MEFLVELLVDFLRGIRLKIGGWHKKSRDLYPGFQFFLLPLLDLNQRPSD